ncbi:hypothetical protein BAUCODRAFT_311751 [Baudoinia panamericana UAMH 10762]|uniref:Polynucleotide 5'-hydroxyl-kinase GRC3 n=1 Tax=Baudoinia panamericana (strain UAMH 10762) TaxID=717646 RepID=M2N046_BAUPA|nr:uncharacterized protein BAUCODRAFT_311751 [Baudoinia panamericana UAMH 10762]EMC91950.1 hypothetical protein BAUCODRAFT_311751 [Baudoinia panamericana UAMH 10762]
MALPGFNLPGLGIRSTSTPQVTGTSAPDVEQPSRREELAPQSEWRFEAGFIQSYSVRLVSGHAELFGVELAQNQTHNLSGLKGAVFTWQGCELEVIGEAESEYSAQETEYATEWINLHGMLESARDGASEGPRVLVVGPDSTGKSSMVRSLAAWAVRQGRAPTVVHLDPREGLLAPPSSLTAVTIVSQMEVDGWGISPMTGPSLQPVRSPLVYHFPYATPSERPNAFKAIVTRSALTTLNKLEEDPLAKQSGIIIDTPGGLNDPKSNYDMIHHIISEFSINLVVALGSERLYNDLNRRYTSKSPEDAIAVLKLAKPGGAVERDNAYMKQLRARQVRQYFFGSKESLNPHSHSIPTNDLTIYRAKPASSDAALPSFGAEDEDDYDPAATSTSSSNTMYEKVAPSLAMTGALIAIKFCSSNSEEATIRDSAIMGYLYVADVDEARKKVRFLAPHPQRWGDRALVWGTWPEAAADLVR